MNSDRCDERLSIQSVHSAPPNAMLDAGVWTAATSLEEFLGGPVENQALWRTMTRLARLSTSHHARARALSAPARLLVLLEDWCGDAMYSIPFAQRIAESSPQLALRVLQRDQHDALMSTHLTDTSRSIPVVMLFDHTGHERAWWGPRPAALQEWVLTAGLTMEESLRYKGMRTWYARDRGESTAHELLTMLEGAQ